MYCQDRWLYHLKLDCPTQYNCSAHHWTFWFVAEGVVVGLVIGYACTRIGGEGPETAGR